MDNLHFIPNNILTIFYKELKKYKKDYQQYFNYIYIYMNYITHLIVYFLSVSMHMHVVTSQYMLIAKAQRKFNQILIEFSILCHVFHLIFNFVLSELLSIKIEEFKSNQILNWILIGVQFLVMCSSKLLIFVTNELLGANIEESKDA